MYDMKRLAELVKTLEDQLMVCMRCGMCQAVCPLFSETGRESDVARGKLALLDGLLQEMFKDPMGVSERLSRCLLCGSCAANCPSGVKVLEIFMKARAILRGYMGLSPVKKALFRGMLARPEFFDRLLEWASRFQSIFTKPVDDLLGTSCSRFLSPLSNRQFRSLAPVPFHRIVDSLDIRDGGSGLKVGFLVGCLIDKVFPNVAQSVVRSLQHHGVGVIIPEDQACCGIPALSAGDTDVFYKLVRHNLDRFSSRSIDYLITACATCSSTIKKVWPMMLQEMKDHERQKVLALSEKVLDVTEFLVDQLGVGRSALPAIDEWVTLTYHDPCHLKKSLGVADQPRAVIRMNPRYRLLEMAEADRCCGCGGSFNLQHYDISAAIGQRKRDNIVRTGCKVVATGCPACMLHLPDILSRSHDRVLVKHSIEIYAESLDKEVIMLKPIKPKRISDQVFEQLKDHIFRGHFKPGEQLMTERELAQTLGVSRPTVREAINKLVNIGLIEQRQGQGTFVASPADSVDKNPLAAVVNGQDVGLVDLLEVRLGLECNAATMAAQRATEDDIQDLQRSLEEMITEIKQGGLGTHADVSFHMAISYATRNMVQIHIMKNFYDLMFFGIKENLERLYSEPGNLDKIIEQHTNVFETIRRHDPDAAYEAMKQHILFVLNFFRDRNR